MEIATKGVCVCVGVYECGAPTALFESNVIVS